MIGVVLKTGLYNGIRVIDLPISCKVKSGGVVFPDGLGHEGHVGIAVVIVAGFALAAGGPDEHESHQAGGRPK